MVLLKSSFPGLYKQLTNPQTPKKTYITALCLEKAIHSDLHNITWVCTTEVGKMSPQPQAFTNVSPEYP